MPACSGGIVSGYEQASWPGYKAESPQANLVRMGRLSNSRFLDSHPLEFLNSKPQQSLNLQRGTRLTNTNMPTDLNKSLRSSHAASRGVPRMLARQAPKQGDDHPVALLTTNPERLYDSTARTQTTPNPKRNVEPSWQGHQNARYPHVTLYIHRFLHIFHILIYLHNPYIISI